MSIITTAYEWLKSLPETADYKFSMGAWNEEPGRKIALWAQRGRFIDDDDGGTGYPEIRVVLVGERDKRSDAAILIELAEAINRAARAAGCIDNVVRIRPMAGMIGPGYTTENRAWVEISLELMV